MQEQQSKHAEPEASSTKSIGTPASRPPLSRQASTSPQKRQQSPEKQKSKAWNSLWSLDLNLESGK